MKTLAAVLYENAAPLDLREVEIPSLERGQTLVRILYSGVCHTQLNQIYGLKGQDKNIPRLMGHEGSAIVEDVGEGVTKVKRGDYVVLSWLKGYGIEKRSSTYMWGNKPINSGPVTTFAEKAVVAEANLAKLSNRDIPPDAAALLGCAIPTGTGMVFNLLDDIPGKSIAIYGVGGVGSSALLGAKARGYSPIFAVDISQRKLEHAIDLGATHAINARDTNPLAEIMRLTDGKGVDFAIESAGTTRTMEMAFKSLKNRVGKAVIAGNVKKGEMISIDPDDLNQGKKLLGTFGGETHLDRDVPVYERLYQDGKLPIEKLISRVYDLKEINAALDALKNGELCRPLIKISSN